MNEPAVAEEPRATVAALVPVPADSEALVRPAATIDAIESAFTDYLTLCTRLLEPSDFQRIGDREFKKKSAFRKLAVAFGVSCRYADRHIERDSNGRILRAEVVAVATAPNGRYMEGLGVCDIHEKCCDPAYCRKRHTHCAANCSGRIHFSNPEHDLPATAATRATNRACSDLFGMGEVSAEEIGSGPSPADEDGPYRMMGWPGRGDHDAARDAVVEILRKAPADKQAKFKKLREDAGVDLGRLTRSQYDAARRWLTDLGLLGGDTPTPADDVADAEVVDDPDRPFTDDE